MSRLRRRYGVNLAVRVRAAEIVRDAVRRQLALRRFEELRSRMVPRAEALGYVTDEDVFRDVS